MIVVADTTPLISLLKINRFEILRELYERVHIPQAVYNELTENADYLDEAEYIKKCQFLEIHNDISKERVDLLRRATGLYIGESEAIVLADTSGATVLLMDEMRGRSVAEQLGIPITGVIGVLMAAYKKQLLTTDEIKESIEIMRRSNRFIAESLYKLLLEMIG